MRMDSDASQRKCVMWQQERQKTEKYIYMLPHNYY